MNQKEGLVVTSQMLIRVPAARAYEAFVDPALTTRFWFTASDGPLEAGASRMWRWEMYGAAAEVNVKELEAGRRILIEWGPPPIPVEWTFDARGDSETLVTVRTWGWTGTDADVMERALDSKGGFALVLAAAKGFLEHGCPMDLIADQHPEAIRADYGGRSR